MLKIIFIGANSTVSSDGINTHTNWSGFLLLIYDSWSLHLTRIPNICYNDKIHIQNTDKLAEIYTWQEDNWHSIRFTCSGIPDKPRFWEKTLTTFLKVYISMFFFCDFYKRNNFWLPVCFPLWGNSFEKQSTHTSGNLLLRPLAMGAKWYTLKGENVKKCIRVGTAVYKKIHLGR